MIATLVGRHHLLSIILNGATYLPQHQNTVSGFSEALNKREEGFRARVWLGLDFGRIWKNDTTLSFSPDGDSA